MAWQQYENNYCNSDIRCHIRKYLKPFYKLYVYRPGLIKADPNTSWQSGRLPDESDLADEPANDFKHSES